MTTMTIAHHLAHSYYKLYVAHCVREQSSYGLYVTGKLRNQAFRKMPKSFSHFLK